MVNLTSRIALLCLLGSPLLFSAVQAQEKPAPAASQTDLTLPMPKPLPLAPEALRGDSLLVVVPPRPGAIQRFLISMMNFLHTGFDQAAVNGRVAQAKM